jgi:hypothetical protein
VAEHFLDKRNTQVQECWSLSGGQLHSNAMESQLFHASALCHSRSRDVNRTDDGIGWCCVRTHTQVCIEFPAFVFFLETLPSAYSWFKFGAIKNFWLNTRSFIKLYRDRYLMFSSKFMFSVKTVMHRFPLLCFLMYVIN